MSIDFASLLAEGKTVIYQETATDNPPDPTWELWGRRITPEADMFVWRKIVALEEAAKFNKAAVQI